MKPHAIILALAAFLSSPALAMQLDFPGVATLSGEKTVDHGNYHLPISAWTGEGLKTIPTEGKIVQQAWKIAATGLTSLQIFDPLKQQLDAAGFKVIFECETQSCGGFDFRYETDILPEPVMHVDLGDFRFLAARRAGEASPEYLSLIVSRSQDAGFVQLVRIGAPADAPALISSSKNPALEEGEISELSLARALEDKGYFILEDLVFQTGSSDLGGDDFASLTALAEYLNANSDRTVALVGHTDAEGSLAGNIALSKRRAGSVVERLILEFGVDQTQMSAEGNGFLSPRASNLTLEGRTQNRRVEVIITSTE